MDMFARELAPISAKAWGEIDEQARRTLVASLSARRFADVTGPFGWDRSCLAVGGMEPFQKYGDVGYGVHKCVRFVETRIDFAIDIAELHSIDRGCKTADLTAVERAAQAAAAFEDKIVYEGLPGAGIKGMVGSSEIPAAEIHTDSIDGFVSSVSKVTTDLLCEQSIEGPYAFVGGAKLRGVMGKIASGRTWLEIAQKAAHVEKFIYSPSFDGALLVSLRGGDMELAIGGDFTVGFAGQEGRKLLFFISESATFRITEPRAFVELKL